MADKIRLLIVDDHMITQSGLRYIFEECDDIEVVGSAFNGREAVDLCGELKPDLILMDLRMEGRDDNGIEATRTITKEHPDVKVIALTNVEEDGYVTRMVDAGALGFLSKSVSNDKLVASIRYAASGMSVFSPEIVAKITQTHRTSASIAGLTCREEEVMDLVIGGMGNSDIARRLDVHIKTVENHISSILAKLSAKNRVDAVLKYKKLDDDNRH